MANALHYRAAGRPEPSGAGLPAAATVAALIYVVSREERERIERLLRGHGHASVRLCNRAADFSRRASEVSDAALAICEVTELEEAEVTFSLQTLRRRFPDVPVLLLLNVPGVNSERITSLAADVSAESAVRRGVDDLT
ncbi:MAG: hypothetical protein ACREON_20245 [Gemmatimonadaceae bacterium]